MFPSSDPNALRRQYADDTHLRTWQDTHDRYSVPRVNFPEWVLSRTTWRGSERVLDVGSGIGIYREALTVFAPNADYTALDHSFGILLRNPNERRMLGDAQALPFQDDTFDVILANHMLHHVQNIPQALREFRRVLKPDGVLLTATNSLETMPEFSALMRRAIMLLSPPGSIHVQPPMPDHTPFSLENGTRLLAREFYAVVRHDLPSTLVFKEVEPAMLYLESRRETQEPQLPPGIYWDDVMALMREQLHRVLKHFNELVVNKLSGVLIASERGGFIGEYTSRKS
jgi:SAM-dependent methyltransferase